MRDEHPGKAFLTSGEVRKLLSIGNKQDFTRFAEENPMFPKPVQAGTTRGKKPRLLYPKSRVYAFIELLGG